MLATGARHAYFGHDEWEPFAPGLKTLLDVTTIRGRILLSFERAERELDPERRAALLTFVIIGGGPTGVELAGTIAELAHDNLPGDFRHIDTRKARIVLIEAGPRILPSFTEDLAAYAHAALCRLGVEIALRHPVSNCSADGVRVADRHLPAKIILWAADVRASAASDWLGMPADHANRVKVEPDLSTPARGSRSSTGSSICFVRARFLAHEDRPRSLHARHLQHASSKDGKLSWATNA